MGEPLSKTRLPEILGVELADLVRTSSVAPIGEPQSKTRLAEILGVELADLVRTLSVAPIGEPLSKTRLAEIMGVKLADLVRRAHWGTAEQNTVNGNPGCLVRCARPLGNR